MHAATTGGEEGGVPTKEPVVGERLVVALSGVEHHLDDAFDVPVCRNETANVHPQATGDGGANLVLIEDFAFNLAGFEDVLGEGFKNRLCPELETQSRHSTGEPALPTSNCGKRFGQAFRIPSERRPSF
ncbi:hypothetical protein GCM10009101_17020 [Brevundimonas lenta]